MPALSAGKFGWLDAAIVLSGDPGLAPATVPLDPCLTGGAGGVRLALTGGGGAALLRGDVLGVDAADPTSELVEDDADEPEDGDKSTTCLSDGERAGDVGERMRICGGALPTSGSSTKGTEGSRMCGRAGASRERGCG